MYEEIARNKRRSFVLLAGFLILLLGASMALNYLLSFGWIGVVIAVLLAGGSGLLSWYRSDSIALSLARARPVTAEEQPQLYNIVEGLCIAGGLPRPRLYVVDDAAPNAFATGRDPDHAAVAVTSGLLMMMNRTELEGVIAHELSHIRNYDIRVMTIAVTTVGVLTILSDLGLRALYFRGGRQQDRRGNAGILLLLVGLVFLIVAPIAGRLMQFAVSRRREFLADASAIQLTRYPEGLIQALEKLRGDSTVVVARSQAMAHLWIEQPLDVQEGSARRLNRLFMTHPPIDERIDALRRM